MKEINIDVTHEKLFLKKSSLAFSDRINYPLWKEEVRKKYLELLGMDNIAKNVCDLNIEIEEVIQKDGYTRYRFTFESEKNCVVPCYLLIPKIKKKKYPVCICLQGHTTGFHISIGEKKYDIDDGYLETSTFALDAVKNGFAALCIEQRGMGERTTLLQNRHRKLTCACEFVAMTALLLGRTLIGERVWDVHRGIDALEHFKEDLDLDDITVLGNSGGGTATYYSACFDQRIKMAISCSAISTYRNSIGNVWHCPCNYIPHIAEYVDMGELSTLIAPRKLIVTIGELDPIFPVEGTKEVYSVMEKIYKKENAKNNLRLIIIPDKQHYFDKKMTFSVIKEMRMK